MSNSSAQGKPRIELEYPFTIHVEDAQWDGYEGHPPQLIMGKQKLRLWPHPTLQLARDPKLGKHDNPLPRNLNLATGTLGPRLA